MLPRSLSLLLVAAALLITGCGSSSDEESAPSATAPVPENLALLAGHMGGGGDLDESGVLARFADPIGLSRDASGNLYIADTSVCTIRRLAPDGTVTTIAGLTAVRDAVDGTGADARFHLPNDLVVSTDGNIYVADTSNHTIRRVTPAGVVTTVTGLAGVGGYVDGSVTDARLGTPRGIAADRSGNLYFTDGAYTVRKITPTGVVSTLAGSPGLDGSTDGTGNAARFGQLHGIAVDVSDNVYVADYGNQTIRRITPAGVVTTVAGVPGVSGSNDGPGATALFRFPRDVAVDASGNVYIADTENHLIRRLSPGGTVTTVSGAAGVSGSSDGGLAEARFKFPQGLVADDSGNVYVGDTRNFSIRRIASTGAVTTIAGSASVSGSTDGVGALARFAKPSGLWMDRTGVLYVTDADNHTVRAISGATVSTIAGRAGEYGGDDGTGSAARFYEPDGIAGDDAGNLYVADHNNHTIRKITAAGVVTTLAGSPGLSGSADGVGGVARFYHPLGVAVDAAGTVYVADSFNRTIRKISPTGAVSTFAGVAGSLGSADGTGAAARFGGPNGLALDAAGNLFVVDNGNYTIRRITPAGEVTTIAGSTGVQGSSDGVGSAASFWSPSKAALDGAGNLYVADTGNSTIRRIDSTGSVRTVIGRPRKVGFLPGALPGVIALPRGIAVRGNTVYITTYNGVVVATMP